jgi:predicted glycoside hydrolase/deacetylase ChbG (UPF0249 family)
LRFLIVNADDFGYGAGVNRGIVEAHRSGVVTSAGLMVNTPGTDEAVELAASLPNLSIGLHINMTNEAKRLVEFDEPEICRAELRRQFDMFVAKMGRLPTHLDSHQHIHRRRPCLPSFEELAREHALPLRDKPPVTFKGGFYGQWEYGVSDPSKVSLQALEKILIGELTSGIYELAVHPGYYDAAADYVYHREREMEMNTLCDPRLRELIDRQQIHLISYHQLPQAAAALANAV